jgi:integrase
METAKKLFFLAYAIGGQRISDIEQIVNNKLYKQDFRAYWQKKTGNDMYSGLLDAYFSKYKNDEIPMYTGQYINTLLKRTIEYFSLLMQTNNEFKRFAESNNFNDAFVRKVSKKSYRGRTQTPHFSTPKPLDKAISFSNARHTFISTLVFRYGKNRDEVMLYTGHSSERILDYYLDKKRQRDAYEADKSLIKPDEKYDFEEVRKYNDVSYLEEAGFFDIDSEEDIINEIQNTLEYKKSNPE